VTFSDTSTGTITDQLWALRDAANTNTNPGGVTHTYTGPGTNTVSLAATGPVGTDTPTQPGYIVVTNPGPVILSIDMVSGGQVQVTRSQGTLLSSDLFVGPYTNILSTNSPFIFAPTGSVQFLRVKVR
jgi:PKD repeat protein